MQYDKRQVAEKLVRWERFLGSYHLPEWEELPQIALYLDQVIALVNQYLGFFVYDPAEEKLLTPSMVNNYVKLKLVPAPVKKRYSRTHVAYLVFVCSLKRVFSIAQVQQLIGLGREVDVDLEQSYDEMCCALEGAMAARFSTETPAPKGVHLLDKAGEPVSSEVSDLLQAALSALADKVYVEQLITLGARQAEDGRL